MFICAGLGYELPSLDIDDEPNHMWAQSYSGNSNSSFELDFLGEGASALMVNPSSVMPFVSSQRRFENKDKVNDSEEAKQSESLEPNEEIDVSFIILKIFALVLPKSI